jgi:hypothetical protein
MIYSCYLKNLTKSIPKILNSEGSSKEIKSHLCPKKDIRKLLVQIKNSYYVDKVPNMQKLECIEMSQLSMMAKITNQASLSSIEDDFYIQV